MPAGARRCSSARRWFQMWSYILPLTELASMNMQKQGVIWHILLASNPFERYKVVPFLKKNKNMITLNWSELWLCMRLFEPRQMCFRSLLTAASVSLMDLRCLYTLLPPDLKRYRLPYGLIEVWQRFSWSHKDSTEGWMWPEVFIMFSSRALSGLEVRSINDAQRW